MKTHNMEEGKIKVPILWLIFRNGVGNTPLSIKVIEKIKMRLKEKIH